MLNSVKFYFFAENLHVNRVDGAVDIIQMELKEECDAGNCFDYGCTSIDFPNDEDDKTVLRQMYFECQLFHRHEDQRKQCDDPTNLLSDNAMTEIKTDLLSKLKEHGIYCTEVSEYDIPSFEYEIDDSIRNDQLTSMDDDSIDYETPNSHMAGS